MADEDRPPAPLEDDRYLVRGTRARRHAGGPQDEPTAAVPAPAAAAAPSAVVAPAPATVRPPAMEPPSLPARAEDRPMAAGPQDAEGVPPAGRRWFTRAWVVILMVTALGGGLRFWHLSSPHAYVFDEVYYAKDGCYDAGYPWQQCKLTAPGEQTFTVHPPLGRWIIAAGEKLFGNRPFGWRVASATFGTLSVLLIALLALRLFGSALWAGIAGLLLATENLNLVQSRISMLDIFITTFAIAGFLFLVLDREWIERRSPVLTTPERLSAMHHDPLFGELSGEDVPAPILRPWRVAAGVAFGASTASKWSGALALVAGIVLSVAWERTRRKRAGLRHPLREALRDESFGIFVFLGLLPIAVYMASYARWWVDNGFSLAGWWAVQKGMAEYSIHLRAKHPYASPAWRWMLMSRPVAYYYTCARQGATACARPAEILGLANPAILWGAFLTIPYAAWSWARRQDWRAGLIVVAFLVQYVPWFFVARTSFFFYMAPMTPFLVLAMTYALHRMSTHAVEWDGVAGRTTIAPLAVAVVVITVGLFVFFWPVLVGDAVSYTTWHLRIWFYCPSYHGFCQWNWI